MLLLSPWYAVAYLFPPLLVLHVLPVPYALLCKSINLLQFMVTFLAVVGVAFHSTFYHFCFAMTCIFYNSFITPTEYLVGKFLLCTGECRIWWVGGCCFGSECWLLYRRWYLVFGNFRWLTGALVSWWFFSREWIMVAV